MKNKTRLLVACLALSATILPINAEIKQNSTSSANRVTDLERSIRESRLCKNYPVLVKVSKGDYVYVSTFVDRQMNEQDVRSLAFDIANLVNDRLPSSENIKIRFYDPASIKYWKEIFVSKEQFDSNLTAQDQKEKALKEVKYLNNLGLPDGPTLKTRASLYKRIIVLHNKGIDTAPFTKELSDIDAEEREKKNVTDELTKLSGKIDAAEQAKVDSGSTNNTDFINPLKQAWQDACAKESDALKAVQDAEQEQNDLILPGTFPSDRDLDAQTRSQNRLDGNQKKIDDALAKWHEATAYKEQTYRDWKTAEQKY